MRILLVAPMFPHPLDSGLKLRLWHLLRALAQKHEVSLVYLYREPVAEADLAAVRPLCAALRGVTLQSCARYQAPPAAGRWAAVRRAAAARSGLLDGWRSDALAAAVAVEIGRGVDLIWVARLWLESTVPIGAAPTVLDLDDLESVKHRRLLATRPWGLTRLLGHLEAAKLERAEQAALARHAVVVVASDGDRRRLARTNVHVLPNTVAFPEPRTRAAENDDDLVFFGLMSYGPNVDAMLHFRARIWPRIRAARPNARLFIAGAQAPAEIARLHNGQQVFVTGFVEDLGAFLATKAVVVVPLRIGGGTRLKVLDALAYAKAVVTTPIGYDGLELEPGEHVVVAERPADFAAACTALMADPVRRVRIGLAGRERVRERYRAEALPVIVEQILAAAG